MKTHMTSGTNVQQSKQAREQTRRLRTVNCVLRQCIQMAAPSSGTQTGDKSCSAADGRPSAHDSDNNCRSVCDNHHRPL